MMRYLRNKHHIAIKSRQIKDLRNMGYYHGYKGYRFIRDPKNQIPLNNFDELISIINFDMKLKALIYPQIMFIETALKNYVLEAVLDDCSSENLNVVFARSLNFYKSFPTGSVQYKKHFTKRLALRGSINNTLKRDYSQHNRIVSHFFDHDREIPIWAVFESLTLGEFGNFFSCCNKDVKLHTSHLLDLPTNLDADGEMTRFIIFTLKDLRNAIAHNNIIFDARFGTNEVGKRLIQMLRSETSIQNIDFKYIDAYIILIAYVLRKMYVTKTECKQLVNRYNEIKDEFREQISSQIWNQILGTGTRNNMIMLKDYISNS